MFGSLLLLGGHECGIGWKYFVFWNNQKASQQTAKERSTLSTNRLTTNLINRLVTTAMEPSSQDRVNQQPVRRFNHPFYTAGSIILT